MAQIKAARLSRPSPGTGVWIHATPPLWVPTGPPASTPPFPLPSQSPHTCQAWSAPEHLTWMAPGHTWTSTIPFCQPSWLLQTCLAARLGSARSMRLGPALRSPKDASRTPSCFLAHVLIQTAVVEGHLIDSFHALLSNRALARLHWHLQGTPSGFWRAPIFSEENDGAGKRFDALSFHAPALLQIRHPHRRLFLLSNSTTAYVPSCLVRLGNYIRCPWIRQERLPGAPAFWV